MVGRDACNRFTSCVNVPKDVDVPCIFIEEISTYYILNRICDLVEQDNTSSGMRCQTASDTVLEELHSAKVNIFTDDVGFVRGIHELYPEWAYTEVSKMSSFKLYGTTPDSKGCNVYIGECSPDTYADVLDINTLAGGFYSIGTYEALSQVYEIVFGKECPVSVDRDADRKSLSATKIRQLAVENPYPEKDRVSMSRKAFMEAKVPYHLYYLLSHEKVNIFSERSVTLDVFYKEFKSWSYTLVTEDGSLERYGYLPRYENGYNIFIGYKGVSRCSELCKAGFLDGKIFLLNHTRVVYEISKVIFGKEAVGEYVGYEESKPPVFDPVKNAMACKRFGVDMPASVWVELSKLKVNIFTVNRSRVDELYALCPAWSYVNVKVPCFTPDWVPLFGTIPQVDGHNFSVGEHLFPSSRPSVFVNKSNVYEDAYTIAKLLLGEENLRDLGCQCAESDTDDLAITSAISTVDNRVAKSDSLDTESVLSRLENAKVNVYVEDREIAKRMYPLYPDWAYAEGVPVTDMYTLMFGTHLYGDAYSVYIYSNKEAVTQPGVLDGQIKHHSTRKDLEEIGKLIFGE